MMMIIGTVISNTSFHINFQKRLKIPQNNAQLLCIAIKFTCQRIGSGSEMKEIQSQQYNDRNVLTGPLYEFYMMHCSAEKKDTYLQDSHNSCTGTVL